MAFFFPPTPPSLPPEPPVPAQVTAQGGFTLPGDAGRPAFTMEEATRRFGEAVESLSPADRIQIQSIHAGVDQWALGRQNPDRMGQFLVRVMMFADQRLNSLKANPASAASGECQGLERVFLSGYQMVEVYSKVRRR